MRDGADRGPQHGRAQALNVRLHTPDQRMAGGGGLCERHKLRDPSATQRDTAGWARMLPALRTSLISVR